jgi:hypothetical protein
VPRNPNSEPWWKWPDRWQIVDEWKNGVSLNKLGIKYRHDRGQIAQWIDSLGVTKPIPEVEKVAKVKRYSSNIRELCRALVYAEDKLGRPPRFSEIEGVMKVISEEGVFFGTRIRESVAD